MSKITTEEEYNQALKDIQLYMDAEEDTEEARILNILAKRIEDYEDIVFKDVFLVEEGL